MKHFINVRIFLLALVGALGISGQGIAKDLKIGLLITTSGPGAVLGAETKRGWDLAMEHVGGKIGGLDTKIIIGDDQVRPNVAITEVDKLINLHNVDIVSGVLWSHVLMAIHRPVLNSGRILLVTNAGASPLAGRNCHPLYITTSWQNDQFTDATAAAMNQAKVEETFVVVPNYRAGKDLLKRFPKKFKGRVVGSILFPLGQTDFQAELSQIRAQKPKNVMVFAPGGSAIAFFKQWQALKLSKQMNLYAINMVDAMSLPAIGKAAIGTWYVSPWNHVYDSPANKRFVSDFKKKHGRLPTQYAAQAYDAVVLLDAAIKARKGDISNRSALVKAMTHAKVSTTRNLKYNVNHFPIQNFYKLRIVAGPSGHPEIKAAGIAVANMKDDFVDQCRMK